VHIAYCLNVNFAPLLGNNYLIIFLLLFVTFIHGLLLFVPTFEIFKAVYAVYKVIPARKKRGRTVTAPPLLHGTAMKPRGRYRFRKHYTLCAAALVLRISDILTDLVLRASSAKNVFCPALPLILYFLVLPL